MPCIVSFWTLTSALRAKTMLCYIFLIKLSPQIDIKLVLTWKAPLLRNLNILGSVRPFGLLEPSACWAWIRSAVIFCCCNNWIVITGIITGWKFQDSDTKGQVSGDSDGKSYCLDVFIPDQVRLLFIIYLLHPLNSHFSWGTAGTWCWKPTMKCLLPTRWIFSLLKQFLEKFRFVMRCNPVTDSGSSISADKVGQLFLEKSPLEVWNNSKTALFLKVGFMFRYFNPVNGPQRLLTLQLISWESRRKVSKSRHLRALPSGARRPLYTQAIIFSGMLSHNDSCVIFLHNLCFLVFLSDVWAIFFKVYRELFEVGLRWSTSQRYNTSVYP